jgi:lipopolysaccharide/colanic/teichoic acid biosynthesis glycosyltransferase
MEQVGWRLRVKRSLDCGIAAGGLIVAAPLMGGIAIAVRATLGKPVLFRQTRPGLHGRPITVLKFRTMRNEPGSAWFPTSDGQRLTRFGRLLRKSSLDELPQLWNVLRGDLSLVGPRPLLMEYLERYTPEQMRRHDVLPGITGWAQVNGRNAIDWERKFELDIWYVDNWSLALDLRILGRTMGRVLARDGVVQPGQATVSYFQGSIAKES